MKYYEVNFCIEPNTETYSDVFSALLAEIGFESFVPTENGLQAYIQQTLFEEDTLKQCINEFPFTNIKIIHNFFLCHKNLSFSFYYYLKNILSNLLKNVRTNTKILDKIRSFG